MQNFIGFPHNKATDLKTTTGTDEAYYSNNNQPGDSIKILDCLVSVISTVHSSRGKSTLSLNVFLFVVLFVSVSTECIVLMWTRECTHN